MKLTAVSFITPVRFHGDRIDIARAADFECRELQLNGVPWAMLLKRRSDGKGAVVPIANAVQEFEPGDEPAATAEPAPAKRRPKKEPTP